MSSDRTDDDSAIGSRGEALRVNLLSWNREHCGPLCLTNGGSLVAYAPYISCECRNLIGRELRATHGRHRTPIILRLRDTFRDRLLDSRVAAIAPQPLLACQIRTQG